MDGSVREKTIKKYKEKWSSNSFDNFASRIDTGIKGKFYAVIPKTQKIRDIIEDLMVEHVLREKGELPK